MNSVSKPRTAAPCEKSECVVSARHSRYTFASIVDASCFYDQDATYPLQMWMHSPGTAKTLRIRVDHCGSDANRAIGYAFARTRYQEHPFRKE